MEEIFTALEAMTSISVIVLVVKIVIMILLICAIFETAGNSKAIRREEEKQTELLRQIQQNTVNSNLLMINNKDNNSQ